MASTSQQDNSNRDMTAALAHTVERGLVSSVFQPIVDLFTGQVAGYEALCRPGPDSQFANAEEMFSAAEGHPLGWKIEELARASALNAASGWPRGVMLFINSSPEIVSDARFARTVAREVRTTRGLSPSRVVLEITERCKDREFDGLSKTIESLRCGGFHIAIDDVGAGTSGLNRITNLKPGWLKLDRDLVEHIDRDKVRQHLIRFLVCFGKLSSIRVVAEGIERIEELDALIDLGVHYGQGYLLARPNAVRQDISAEMREHIRDKASLAFPATTGALESTRAGSLVRAIRTVDSSETVSGVAAHMLRDLHQPGVIVADGDRFDGWVDRDVVLRAASDGRAGLPISFLLGSNRSTVEAGMPIVELLDMASTRDEHSMASPIVVLDRERIMGIVTLPDLLQAGASLCRATQFRYAPLTGLPGRVRTDLYLNELLAGDAPERGVDAAFIDIMGFAGFNQFFGYELGDQLIQEFVGIIRSAMAEPLQSGACFLGHLGDDHFILTAPGEVLATESQRIAREFEALQPQGRQSPGPMGVRIMVAEQIHGRCKDTKDLFRVRSKMRAELDRGNRMAWHGPSDLIVRRVSDVLGRQREGYRRKTG